jgi:phage terminase small subunit
VKALTPKQRRFIEAYSGNGTEAARLAGYKGTDAVLGQVAYENLRKPEIAAAIKAREETESRALIANRAARQEFWTSVMRGTLGDSEVDMSARLKASELLGRSEADFTDKQEHSGSLSVSIAINRVVAKK